MRLAVFTSQFPGRVNTFFARDLRGLIDAGVDVEVFATHPLEADLWKFVPDELSSAVLPRHKVHHASIARSVRTGMTWPAAWRRATDVAAVSAAAVPHGPTAVAKSAYVMAKALAWAREHGSRFDHVLAYWGNYAGTCAYVFQQAAGGRLPFSTFLHAGTDLYRSRVYLRQKLQHADNIIVVCEFNREFLRSVYPSTFSRLAPKIYLHHLGLDLAATRFTPGPRPPRHIVAAGGLHPMKGFDDLVRAVAQLPNDNGAANLTFVGGGPEEGRLRDLAASLGIADRVRFAGWQSPAAVLRHIAEGTVLVHPSSGLGDAVPTVIKEAMAVGTPVIASAVAGIPELLDEGRCGALVPPRQPAQLADAIALLLNDEPRRLAYAAAARARAEALFCQARNGAALADYLRRTPSRQVVATATSH
ncbi:MAG: glycosyltransferase [Acidobacteria bacterium]|nr:glycosyltransferase [Acidobacteriota bacterium]